MNFASLAMRLKPTGDYPPFLALVNRFIERSFESEKRSQRRCETSNLRSTDTILAYGIAPLCGLGDVRGLFHGSPVLDRDSSQHCALAGTQAAGARCVQGPPAALDRNVAGDGRNHVAVAICFGLAEPTGVDSGRVVAV